MRGSRRGIGSRSVAADDDGSDGESHRPAGRLRSTGVTATLRGIALVVLSRLSRSLTALEIPTGDPWAIREIRGLWRLRRRVCRVLEAIEESS